ncbi:putative zinc-containing alcohol dehydrogenase [Pleomassaria siparia CBS 279.74]|uniref:Putative zinc-containing alcohol dehydrogenase n=1 Tax=Pleomassaria siparia CBS 279.74 TaxID=1314801 RepID=A0A6G1K8V8_9PLEO|nr:putative zinc-containing alcohol dehydrogenase [Pleomassaria siparia CBS 279.74]
MSTQTVFRITLKDGIDGIRAFQEPIPSAGPYEVLVKIHSVALNYRDIAIATSTYILPTRDHVIPISDMAGEVVQVGERVDGLAVGDGVIPPVIASYMYGGFKQGHDDDGYGSVADGMLREYVVLPATALVKLPQSSLGFAQWAAVCGTGSTVWNAFYGNTALKPGDTVLLQGTGGVSMTGLVFAKAAGATTIVTSSSDEKLAFAKSLGAHHTVNYKTHPNWATEVLRITDGQGVDHIIENGGLGTIEQSLECITASGIISLIGFLDMAEQKQPNMLIPAIAKAVTIRGIRGGSKHQLEEVVRYMGKRGLAVPVDKTFGFNREEIVAAFKYVASGKHVGKVCISLD